MASRKPQPIDVGELNLFQLAEVRKQLEEEMNHLTSSFAQLKQVQSKFKGCIDNVNEIKPENKGKTILVPLTNSLYVPGKLCDIDNVIVDVGTGYYVQKTRPQAVKYYENKIQFLKENLDSLQETIQKKQDNLNVLLNFIQSKTQAQGQGQGQPEASSKS